jgi:diadenosine tetraphosphate (Ap4A) HIT family hydrolase
MMRAGQALDRVFAPMKMNFQILGNAVPHLHAHILPRYYGDPAPHRPLDPSAGQVILTAEEYAERIALIRAGLA